MNSVTNIRQSTCFDVLFKMQSWLPDTNDTTIPIKIRAVVLEKLLQCQQEFVRTLEDIQACKVKPGEFHGLIQILTKLKLFNDRSQLVANFLNCPLGQIIVPTNNDLYCKVQKRLDQNFIIIEKNLQATLEKLLPYLEEKSPLSLDFFEKLFGQQYSCFSFSPLYVKLLIKNSPLQIKDWLNSDSQTHKVLTTFPCYVIQKIFNDFQQSLNCKSYPKGFIKENLYLIKYYSAVARIKNATIRQYLHQLENTLNKKRFICLTKLENSAEIEALKKIVLFMDKFKKYRSQLIRFLSEQEKETLPGDFKTFKSLIKKYPTVKSRHWKNTLALYRSHKELFIRLFEQRCFRNKSRRSDKFIHVGLHEPEYLMRLIELMAVSAQGRKPVFYRLAKHFSFEELIKLKPIIMHTNNDNFPALLQGLHYFTANRTDMFPLLEIPDEKRDLWFAIFSQMTESSKCEIKRVFDDLSELKTYASLYHPYAFKPFILRIRDLIAIYPELKIPFETWLSKIFLFLSNQKNESLKVKNRSIALRALEMPPEHLILFFQYASKCFYYRHLSHLLYLEKNCRKHFAIVMQFVEAHPEHLFHLTGICNRFGKSICSKLLKTWRIYPEITTQLLTYSHLSKCFFDGFLEFIKSDISRVLRCLDLNVILPGLFERLDQDIHLISSSFLDQLWKDAHTRILFSQLIRSILPHMSSHVIRQLCESFENHPKETLRALNVAQRNPPSLLHLLKLIQGEDSETLSLLTFLETQSPQVSYKLAILLEHYEERELAKSIYRIMEELHEYSLGLRLLDLAMEGYCKEASELANRFLCYQFSSFNKFLFGLADSKNASIINSALAFNDKQKRIFQNYLATNQKDLKLVIQAVCAEHYSLLECLHWHPNNKRSMHDQLIFEHLSKGNVHTAKWLMKNDLPPKSHVNDLIESILESINKAYYYNSGEKNEAFEVGLSIGTALSIMSPDGVINRFLIPKIKNTILNQTYIPTNTYAIEHIIHVLDILEKDVEDLVFKFVTFEKPNKPIKQSVNNILFHFFENHQTEDYRYCVLSALLMRPRQHNLLGNCFASQLSIQMSSCARGLSLAVDDYFEILCNGSLKRTDPVTKQINEYKLPEEKSIEIKPYPSDHPLVRSREILLTQMGREVYSLKLHRENATLLSPRTRHNYLFRIMENSGQGDMKKLLFTAKNLKHIIEQMSDVRYDAYAIDPSSKSPGAWRLIRKDTNKPIICYEEYQEFLIEAIRRALDKADEACKKILLFLQEHLMTSTRFKDKLHSYYKRRKNGPYNRHWLDYSGGTSEGVRLRYFECEPFHISKTTRYIHNAKEALLEIFTFYERLSARVCDAIAQDKHYRVPVDYSNHCANLLLHEIKDRSALQILEAISADISGARKLVFMSPGYGALIELFREKLSSEGECWAHFMFNQDLENIPLGDFCDFCMKGLQILCVNLEKQGQYITAWENILRSHLTLSLPKVFVLIDTNWKEHPYSNVNLGIGGSIFYQQPIFFCSHKDSFIAQNLHLAKGAWEFHLPLDL